ncbi:hypothetical protein IKT18_03750 [Candidatus Saccharibacteria bacterium]|nr:hypothetical protein [Candidatus Saccharibacteria bacterium]
MSKLSNKRLEAAKKCHKCPKCGAYYTGYPALSREDNKTKVCPECGIKEVFLCANYFFIERLK